MHRSLSALFALCLAAFPCSAAVTGVVMTSDGQPVAGARVSLRALETSEMRTERLLSASPEAVPIASTQTDAKGAFSLESPKQPVVDLTVSARGFVPTQRRIENDEEVGAIALTKGDPKSGTVTANGKAVAGATVVFGYGGFEQVEKTDEQGRYQVPDVKRLRGLIVIHPDYAIDDASLTPGEDTKPGDLNRRLTAGTTITGRVVGENGQTPVAKATVRLDQWPLATTADDGTFTIARAPSRWTSLLARKDSLLGNRAFSKDTAYTIRLGKGATISGRLTNAKTKLPIAGASVGIATRQMWMTNLGTWLITDAKGAFSAVIPAGTYMLMPSHPAYQSQSADVSAIAGQSSSKDLTMQQLGRVSGVVIDEAKNPVAAAMVIPQSADPTGFMRGGPMRFARDLGPSVSGPDGRFSVRVTLDTDMLVQATKKGMPGAKSESFKLGPGERKSGMVLVIPTGIAVSGRVTDAQGNPLSGIAVTAAEAEAGPRGMMVRNFIMMGGAPREEDAVRTGSDGTFTMRLKEGTYDFAFKGEGFAPKLVRGQTITPASSPAVDATLDPAVEITGRVVRGGAGVPDVRIFAMGGSDMVPVTTGPDGAFTIGGLAEGPVRVMARKEDEFVQEMRSITAPARDVVIELRAGGRVSGRVVEKGTNKAIPAFQVGVATSRASGGMMMMAPPQLRDFTSDDGSFVLENVPAGAMVLVANAPGYASARMNVTIEEGKSLSDLELQLDTGVKLTGRVTGPNGQGIGQVQIGVVPSPTGNFASSGIPRNAVTDDNGEYTLDGLEAGEETISFTHASYSSARKNVTLKGRETRLDVQLTAGQKVTGVVVTESGTPVAEATVEAMGASFQSTRTNASGSFEFDALQTGRYRFSASKSGYAEGSLDDYDSASGAPARIVLKTGGTIYGRVTGLSPQELNNIEVHARGGRTSASGVVDPQGNYRIEGTPTGAVQVSAATTRSPAGYRSSSVQTVEIAPGGSQQVDIVFRGDVVVKGRIMRNGQPLSGASVMFSPKSSQTQASSSTSADDQGAYSVSGLEEGDYNVIVSDMQRTFSPYHTTYRVSGSGTFDIDYKAGMVRGRVTDSGTGEAVANVSVQLRPPGTETFRMTRGGITDSTGSFVIDSVPPGSYTVTAGKEGYGNHVQDLYVSDSGVDSLDVRIARNDGVALKVIDARDGRPLSAVVIVYDLQGRVVHETRYMFGGGADAADMKLPLGPGTYSASVQANGYAPRNVGFQSPSQQSIALTPGGTLHVRSTRSTSARIRLVDSSGLPYPRFAWMLLGRELLPSPAVTTYQNVAPGTYTLQLLGDNEVVLDSKQVTVAEGQASTTEI